MICAQCAHLLWWNIMWASWVQNLVMNNFANRKSLKITGLMKEGTKKKEEKVLHNFLLLIKILAPVKWKVYLRKKERRSLFTFEMKTHKVVFICIYQNVIFGAKIQIYHKTGKNYLIFYFGHSKNNFWRENSKKKKKNWGLKCPWSLFLKFTFMRLG